MAKRSTKPTKQQKATPQRTGEFAWRPAFLAALRQHGNVTAACDHAGINRTTAYRLRESDEMFKSEWDDALLEAADRIEFEALRRAKRGVLKPVYYQGKRVGYEREYSDTLMGMALKAHKPEKYRERLTLDVNVDIKAFIADLRAAGIDPDTYFHKAQERIKLLPKTGTGG